MKTVTATAKGVAVNYESTNKSSFIPYGDIEPQGDNRRMRYHYQMNNIQYGLYQQLMLGPKAYSQNEFESMPENTRRGKNELYLWENSVTSISCLL